MPRKRRSFSASFKSKVALDAIKGLKTVADTARFVTVRWGFDPSVKSLRSVPHGSQPHATVD
jgi:hypothetical protein